MTIDNLQPRFKGDNEALRILLAALQGGDRSAWGQLVRESRRGDPVDLTGINLDGLDLTGVSFWKVRLCDSTLRGASVENVDFRDADLANCDLREMRAAGADFGWSSLDGANLSGSDCSGSNFEEVHAERTNFSHCLLNGCNFRKTRLAYSLFNSCDLAGANLYNADLGSAEIRGTDLSGADLRFAILTYATLAHVNLSGADLERSWVFGVSAWDVEVDNDTKESELGIDRSRHPWLAWNHSLPQCTAPGLEFAQLLGLVYGNQKLGRLIDAVSRRMVLILGRFSPDRLAVLTALHEDLRGRDLAPVIFNFDGPEEKNVTETVRVLGGLAGWVVADLSDPKSVPQEIGALVPSYPNVPLIPIIQGDQDPYAMFPDWQDEHNVLETIRYKDAEDLTGRVENEMLNRVAAFREGQESHRQIREENERLREEVERLKRELAARHD
ncbi:MAG: pentapeptide repeat-containing protein [Candidatus Thiodiazotropha sp. (ex Ctena orbiculata)]|nr:pentapeptide repeat-containing protein [Candidatus Thiodiazotropha taylori]